MNTWRKPLTQKSLNKHPVSALLQSTLHYFIYPISPILSFGQVFPPPLAFSFLLSRSTIIGIFFRLPFLFIVNLQWLSQAVRLSTFRKLSDVDWRCKTDQRLCALQFEWGEGGILGIVCVPSLIVPAGEHNSIFFYINSSCESVAEGKKRKHIVSGTELP